jgi:FKBP-type peptidyl-prolyl cis-trans isomerase
MKNTIILLAIAVAASSCNNTNKSSSEFNLKSETDSVSYAIGHAIAQTLINQNKQIQNQSPDLNMDIISQSILANFSGDNKSMIDSAVSQQIIQNYFMKKQQLEEGNVKESGMQFLEENKNKEGIQVTESGLQYTVIFEGDGKQPSETSNVTVHYHGTTPEGFKPYCVRMLCCQGY